MPTQWLRRGAGAFITAALLLAGFATVAAASAGPVDRPFAGGTISQLSINDGPTQGSFANVSYGFDQCGTQTGETACTWRVDIGLAPEGFELCPSTLDSSMTIWTSGEQTANGMVSSGPATFALRGTPGQVLCVVLNQIPAAPGRGRELDGSSSTVLTSIVMDPDLVGPIEAMELKIIRGSPPAQTEPPPTSTPFYVSSNCRTLTIGTTQYAFLYRQIGCFKATNLAKMTHISRGLPVGYWCRDRADGGRRCSRQGHPRKFVEWRLPGRVPNPAG